MTTAKKKKDTTPKEKIKEPKENKKMGFSLNLTDADLTGFDALPAGKGIAEVESWEMRETQGGEDKKLPAGVPMLSIQWNITEPEDLAGRKQFSQFVLPPDDLEYDAAKLNKIKGAFVRFLIGIGYSEEEIMSDSFDVDADDYIGKSACITWNRYEYPKGSGDWRNSVKGVNPVDTYMASSTSGII